VAVALCLKYKEKLRSKVLTEKRAPSNGVSGKRLSNGKSTSPGLSVADLEEAEVEILKQVQSDVFPSEIRSIHIIQVNTKYGSRELYIERKALSRQASSLRSLDPVLDSDGIMRVGGRIWRANLSVTLKNSIILPKSSHITLLIISPVHKRTHHGGRGMTLNELHVSDYWIVSRNAMVRQFISKCVTCHLRGSQGEQKMADLPKSCIEPAPPFTYCGFDFFGPWHVQQGRAVMKRYGTLFTCFSQVS